MGQNSVFRSAIYDGAADIGGHWMLLLFDFEQLVPPSSVSLICVSVLIFSPR